MDEAVFISICIPAYKRVSFLKRLLDSIRIQTFRDFEVVLADDSPGNEVYELSKAHGLADSIRYFKNEKTLGTPENWNESIRRARGKWIKLMHDDDWFSDPGALGSFANAIKNSPGSLFFFSGYTNVFLDQNKSEPVMIPGLWRRILERNTKSLISRNVIGPPSVTIHKNIPGIAYDPALKWLVDIDFYIRFLKNIKPVLITENLVRVGVGKDQVTKMVFRNPVVEIPENFYLLDKIGIRSLKSIIVYDAYWRFIRNLNIRSLAMIREAGYEQPVPGIIESMIRFQATLPIPVLKSGFISKSLMFLHYIIHYSKLTRG